MTHSTDRPDRETNGQHNKTDHSVAHKKRGRHTDSLDILMKCRNPQTDGLDSKTESLNNNAEIFNTSIAV